MSIRNFPNPFNLNYPQNFKVNYEHVKKLILEYVTIIIERTKMEINDDVRGDLYVGNAGIAYMFWKLYKSDLINDQIECLDYAKHYIDNAKFNAKNYSKRADERCAFLCGNAGIYAVSAMISLDLTDKNEYNKDLDLFKQGFDACKPVNYSKYGGDEILVGRAGYLSGIYWLNENINPKPISDEMILELCESVITSGRQYSKKCSSPLPLMYQYHGTEYLGAAHGVCAIYHMLLKSPWFNGENLPQNILDDIRKSIDRFLDLQDVDGNFPVSLESVKAYRKEKKLVHWCHGAPGAVYLLAKAYLTFGDEKYLHSAKKATNLIWEQGLLYKGPGICHGVAGNGYAFLLLYRLTQDVQYLFMAAKFMEFLKDPQFISEARTPDRPFSLYEGLAGTVCFLVDLLNPNAACFPFMNVF